MAADPVRDDDAPVISRREIWMKQETVITKRVTWYVSINGRGNNNQLVDNRVDRVEAVVVGEGGDRGDYR